VSDQTLKLFVVDLRTGQLKRIIDTGIANAFAGTITGGVIDTDRSRPQSPGWYSDDAVYVPYTATPSVCSLDAATDCNADTDCTGGKGVCRRGGRTNGGVLRLLTLESDNPADWTTSVLVDQVRVGGTDTNIGPVSTSIAKLQDRKNKHLWIYFGSGRYYFKNDDPTTGTTQKLFGVKEPCYTPATDPATGGDLLKFDGVNKSADCADKVASTLLDQSGDASTAPAVTIGTAPGWFIQLDPRRKVCSGDSSTTCATDGDCGMGKGSCYEYNSERVITDPVASTAGAVLFTTFKPSSDVCLYGGDSLIWALRYDTGGTPPAKTMQGKALMQVSTGAFKEISLTSAFSNPGSKRLDSRRLSVPITGVPPTSQGLSLLTNPPPVKKFIHVREK
jgi:type IV pilus assembly protein PilY1